MCIRRQVAVWLAAAAVTMAPALASAQDGRAAIDAASRAIGADTLKTVEYSGAGFDFVFGQAYSPTSPWPRFADKSYTRQIDFEKPASRMDRVRAQAENPPRGGGQQPVRGDQMQNQTIVVTPATPWVQQLEIWMMPHGFLRAAAANNATVKAQRANGKAYRVVTFTGQNKAAVNGYINDQNLVERVETTIDNPLFGDTSFEAIYSDYRDVGGVKFPMHIVQRQGGFPILDITVSDVKPNAPVRIQAPAEAPAPAAAATPSEKLGDGVYLILGGYASLAIEFANHIVVVEAPQTEARANAVFAEAKRLIPNKPIRYVVNTHHHVDHAGGIRAAMAEGATIVTHESNKSFYEKIAAAPHTLAPDRLSAVRKKPSFETMTSKKVMTDGTQTLELYHLEGSGHNQGLLVAYLPKLKVLLEADAYNPPAQANAPVPAPPSPYTLNLVSAIDRLKLDVETIVPVHYAADNRKVTRAELMRVVASGTR
jgi:glyoxylase-like metal-dependent hydrolase (beta-lactamase superfamily II)